MVRPTGYEKMVQPSRNNKPRRNDLVARILHPRPPRIHRRRNSSNGTISTLTYTDRGSTGQPVTHSTQTPPSGQVSSSSTVQLPPPTPVRCSSTLATQATSPLSTPPSPPSTA